MDHKAIFKFCLDMSCCDKCCLRYLGIKNPKAYENSHEYVNKYLNGNSTGTHTNTSHEENNVQTSDSIDCDERNGCSNGSASPPVKKRRINTCVSCLGILQEDLWLQCFEMSKSILERKCYDCTTFACALSAPITTLLREKAIVLMLQNSFTGYDEKTITPLKEAWKWSFGTKLASHIDKVLDSGAISPLLITINIEYPDDLQELEILKTLSPSHFEARSKERKRFTVEFTRRSVEQALKNVTLEALKAVEGWKEGLPSVNICVKCLSVVCTHSPVYLGGRYIKLSRELPQTPWILNGVRMMDSSVQEIIFEPLAKLYNLSPEKSEHRLKFMSAGREDVDVRCLGEGRPFAIEIMDPNRVLTSAELQQACEDISKGGKVVVKRIIPVTKEDLAELKKGEETKCKTYEALCIKLAHSKNGLAKDTPVVVTEEDIENINKYRNTPKSEIARIVLAQKTPIRVLHRRPLLTRSRKILDLSAKLVSGHPTLFVVRVQTEAGTYIKEWVHGELGRTKPSLGTAIGAPVDILALDVAKVDLNWPNIS